MALLTRKSADPVDAWCTKTGKHQADLAKKAEITEAALSYFKNGKRGLSAPALLRLARVMKVSPDALLRWNSQTKKNGEASEETDGVRR